MRIPQPSPFGGRSGRSTTGGLHYIEQHIKMAWRKGLVVSALLLDLQAAFPWYAQGPNHSEYEKPA